MYASGAEPFSYILLFLRFRLFRLKKVGAHNVYWCFLEILEIVTNFSSDAPDDVTEAIYDQIFHCLQNYPNVGRGVDFGLLASRVSLKIIMYSNNISVQKPRK